MLIAILLLCGCQEQDDYTCVDNAKVQATFYTTQGYTVRYGHGWYKGTPHCWLERQEWVVCSDTVGECKNKPINSDYTVKFYGYQTKEE